MAAVFGQIATPHMDWLGLAPHMVMAGGAVLLLTIVSLAGRRLPAWFAGAWTVATSLAVIGLGFALWMRFDHGAWAPYEASDDGGLLTAAGAIGVGRFAVFVIVLLAAVVVLTVLVADDFLRREKLDGPAVYVLLMLSAAGGMTMSAANNLIVMFLGLEILSLAVYVLVAMHLRRSSSQEAGIKYFVLGAFASAFFLYGIALIYGGTGSLNLTEISLLLTESSTGAATVDKGLFYVGMAMLLVGFGFKVAAVPFHAWTPDVYQGAPSPVVVYMAAGVKAAGFAALTRVFMAAFVQHYDDWQPAVFGLAVASLAVGSLMGIVQGDIKRILAYSSISHAGFILVGMHGALGRGLASVMFYLAAYAAMAIGSFAVVTVVSGPGDENTDIASLRGLAVRRPMLAGAFTLLLLSQAGIPFTVGFWAKFEVISAAADNSFFELTVIAMLATVVAAFLYLRIVVVMYLDPPDADTPRLQVSVGPATAIAIVVLFTLAFGIYPEPLLNLADDAFSAMNLITQ
ncbi:MAG: NADH-quinone oxidoreductase subunit N [Acidimicrobiia bacterium]|nr:NADH-quinone oxidoreductase subunit N [Acidimicrobiia bacterium]MYC57709.1 NADH-quinone oxidoreductase subunit N [Acidimicrobiia bacterium]MYG93613.1 NADH-quinone oxidoreductase subunit N [Acidimicrobiia bacterium]MYI30908.1 NADH-quinone oxidoreductase subunit N [Acidimicrobiia bacterium]